MQNILLPETMKKSDQKTIDSGVLPTDLMHRAAKAIYNSHDFKKESKVLIVCGFGNNGGDGIALANIFHQNKIDFDIYFTSDKLTKDSEYFYSKLIKNCKKNIITEIKNIYTCIVDCIFGVGLSRKIEGIEKSVIERINSFKVHVISCDIPSGINAKNGQVEGAAIKADCTVCIQEYKPGHFLNDAKDYVGKLIKVDIGISSINVDARLVEKEDVLECFSTRDNNSNKYSYGKVLILGGSINFVGAPILAHLAYLALKVGAGLCTIAFPDEIYKEISSHVIDATLMPLKSKNGHIDFDIDQMNQIITSYKVIVVGVGFGSSNEAKQIVKYLIQNFDGKLLIDADGFRCLYDDIDILKDKKADICLTPHINEASKLLKIEKEVILSNPIKLIKDFSKKYNVNTLLKGPSTIVSDGEDVYISSMGSPAQAKGGNGDVLSGVAAGLLSRCIDPSKALYSASYICGEGAQLAENELSQHSLLASELPYYIKKAYKQNL